MLIHDVWAAFIRGGILISQVKVHSSYCVLAKWLYFFLKKMTYKNKNNKLNFN